MILKPSPGFLKVQKVFISSRFLTCPEICLAERVTSDKIHEAIVHIFQVLCCNRAFVLRSWSAPATQSVRNIGCNFNNRIQKKNITKCRRIKFIPVFYIVVSDGKVNGGCLLPFIGEAAANMIAKGRCLFESRFFTFFANYCILLHV